MATAAAAMLAMMYSKDGSRIPNSCKPHHSVTETALSLFLCMGLIISYLPQIVRIIVKRSSVGFSPWFLFLGATSSASSFLNVVSVQWAVVSCCQWLTAGACAESLLGIVQVGLQWFLFMTVFMLFLVFYPRELRYERSIALIEDGQEVEGDEASSSSEGDLDSLDSHIADHYGHEIDAEADANASGAANITAGAVSGVTEQTDDSAGDSALASRLSVNDEDERSSSAFSRLVPTFWPVWKAPPRRHGPSPLSKVTATEPILPGNPASSVAAVSTTPPQDEEGAATRGVPGGSAAHVRIAAPPALRKVRRRKIKTRSPEWGLALSLAWLVAFHFIFILLVTLLLVTSLPSSSFPPPPPQQPEQIIIEGPSSRILVDRWAAFLGWSATILAALQYLPQIVHTARIKLVGSLSIPMMCLQVPGSVLFVYSLALRPGVNYTSLAAYICTGVLQSVLLILCVSWRVRQRRLGIDDFGRPLPVPAGRAASEAPSG